MKNNHEKNILVFLLELISISPLLIILGNVIPPFPLKVHFIGFGLIFLLCLWLLVSNPSKKWVIYYAILLTSIQVIAQSTGLKSTLDFFFGPFIFIIFLDILSNEKLSIAILNKYKKRFYFLLWVPISIATLQYFKFLPLTFWNATYINYAYIDITPIARPNGLLYHGSELAILICFMSLNQLFKKEQNSFWTLLSLILISVTTYYKSLIGCSILIFIYFLAFVNKGLVSQIKLFSMQRLISYSALIITIVVFFAYHYFTGIHKKTGYYFPPQLLTGRGSIWNIFTDGIQDFSVWQYIFGNGMGSGVDIFKNYASAKNWYPLTYQSKLTVQYDAHNALLSLFVNSGISGILFFILLFKMLFTQVKKWGNSTSWNIRVFVAITFIPLMTLGITIPIYDMAIYWPCLGFLVVEWKTQCIEQTKINENDSSI